MSDEHRPENAASTLLEKLEGITVALVTPMQPNGALDRRGLDRLVERSLAHGARCLFPLGWAGEAPRLPDAVRREMIEHTCLAAAGRAPVMAGVSEQSLPRALELAAWAREAGADILLATPPYSYPIPQEIVHAFFRDLAGESGMPLVAYQNDDVGVRIDVETMVQLSRTPGLVGVKAYMPFSQLQQAFHQAHRPGEFAVMSGDESLFGAALMLGVRHFTMGTPGNLCLRWCVGMFRSAVEKDWDAVRAKQKRLAEFCDALYPRVEAPSAAAKWIMHRAGLFASPYVTPPHRELPPEQQKWVAGVLDAFADVVDPFDS
jgi:4-hydroxy-tetrahydrodipicolinate synthase